DSGRDAPQRTANPMVFVMKAGGGKRGPLPLLTVRSPNVEPLRRSQPTRAGTAEKVRMMGGASSHLTGQHPVERDSHKADGVLGTKIARPKASENLGRALRSAMGSLMAFREND